MTIATLCIKLSRKTARYLFVCSILSFCNGKATVALYSERIRTRLGVVHFQVFRLFLWLLWLFTT